MDWEECLDGLFVKQARRDDFLISSLLKSSSKKYESSRMLVLNETTASSKVILAYDSLRELLEALALSKEFKIYNHDCFCAFLKAILSESFVSGQFDKIRRVRNAINYYGKDISLDEAESLLVQIDEIRSFIRSRYFLKK